MNEQDDIIAELERMIELGTLPTDGTRVAPARTPPPSNGEIERMLREIAEGPLAREPQSEVYTYSPTLTAPPTTDLGRWRWDETFGWQDQWLTTTTGGVRGNIGVITVDPYTNRDMASDTTTITFASNATGAVSSWGTTGVQIVSDDGRAVASGVPMAEPEPMDSGPWKDVNKIYELAQDIFGEEFTDLQDGNKIMIHFPKLEMSNSKGYKHVIYDLYIIFQISLGRGGSLACHMSGRRGRFSVKEWDSAYSHSHLPTGGRTSFNSFCFGSSQFGILLQHVQIDSTEQSWEMLFLALRNYLIWESLEGGPHIYMEQIKPARTAATIDMNELLKTFISKVPTECFDFTPKGIVRKGATPAFYNVCNQWSPLKSVSAPSIEVMEARRKEIQQNNRETYVLFKGQRRPLEIYVDDWETPGQQTIDTSLVVAYSELINSKLTQYNNKLIYGTNNVSSGKDKVFRKAGIIKFPNLNS